MKEEIEKFIAENNLEATLVSDQGHLLYPIKNHYLVTDGECAVFIKDIDYAEFTLPRGMRRPIQDIFPYLDNLERNWLQMGCYFGDWSGNSFQGGISSTNKEQEKLNW